MSKTIEEILAPKPEARPRIYAYSIDDKAHAGLLKVGQTTRDVKQRVAEQTKTAAIKATIELDEPAERDDGTTFTDHEVRAALVKKKFENTELEWMRCTVKDVKAVLMALRTGQQIAGTRDQNFPMRREQRDMHAVPRFLWNAKMRFGKTFTSYQLANRAGRTAARAQSHRQWL
jgi:T5orf172 domain